MFSKAVSITNEADDTLHLSPATPTITCSKFGYAQRCMSMHDVV